MLQSRHAARLALPGPEAACCSDMRKWTKKAFTWAILPMLMPTSTGFSFTPACWLGHVHRRVSCAPARASFLRHVVSCGPDDISSTDHLYSYGADKLRREITINGVPAVDLICWPFVMGQPCDCGGAKAHLDHLRGACGKHLSGELGACSGCKKNRSCHKPHPTDVLSSLLGWYATARGPPVLVGKVPGVDKSAGQRSVATATGTSAATAGGGGGGGVLARLHSS